MKSIWGLEDRTKIKKKGVLFISQTDLVKSLQIPVSVSNLKKFPFFTPKGHPGVFWVVCIILQLQSTAIENARINTIGTINMINRIDCINQYKYNRYDWSDQFTLQTSPTQLHHCCLLFRFAWLIKISNIVVLHPLSYCWCAYNFFIFCFCLPLNLTVVPTVHVRLLSQQEMGYCCIYRSDIFPPCFLLLIEPSYCVPGAINCNKEDITIMSSLTQDYDSQSSDDLLSIW